MTSFTATPLVDSRYLIEGQDYSGYENSTVVDGTQWDLIKQQHTVREAEAALDADVEKFFAPLTEAAERAEQAAAPTFDPLLYVVTQEGTEHVHGRAEQLVKLTNDSVILRVIDSGDHSRLRWVGDDLVITAPGAGTGTAAPEEPAWFADTGEQGDSSEPQTAPSSDPF